MNDDEGYSCVEGGLDFWFIVDRYGVIQEDQPAFDSYDEARPYADQLNDVVIARRFGEKSPAVQKPRTKKPAKAKAPALKPFQEVLESLSLFD